MYPPDSAASDLDLLRAICERQGVVPTDADLEAVRGFVDRVVPALEEIDRRLPADTAPEP